MLATSRRALVDGHGPAGVALQSQMHFDIHVGRRDVVRLLDESLDLVVCATTAPSGAWETTGDLQHLTTIARTISRVRARHVVAISSTAVFDARLAADEESPIGIGDLAERGRHVAWFEDALREYHPSLLAMRLPTCVGAPLEPSLVADLLLSGSETSLDVTEWHQLYDVGRLASDLQRSLDAGLRSVNLVSEPVQVRDVLDAVGSRAVASYLAAFGRVVREPVRTRYASVLGASGEYLTDRATALASLSRWWHAQAGVPTRKVS